MLNYLFELLLFAGKAVIVVLTVGAIVVVIAAAASTLKRKEGNKSGGSSGSEIMLVNLSRRKERQRKHLQKMLRKIDPDERLKRESEADKKGGLFSFFGGKKKKNKEQAVEAVPAEVKAAEADLTALKAKAESEKGSEIKAELSDERAEEALQKEEAQTEAQLKQEQKGNKDQGLNAAQEKALESAEEADAKLVEEQAEEALTALEPEPLKEEAAEALQKEEAQTEAELKQDLAEAKAEAKADKAESTEAANAAEAQTPAPAKTETALEKKKAARQEKLERLSKLEQEGVFCPRNVFVINFNGSTNGAEVKKLRRQIDALLLCADKRDEAVVLLTSPGGMVNSYGLLSSQLMRIRNKGIYLTVCVDSVAASGGYLMACVANKIVAAPFAYIGSIGVVAGIPNFNRLMDKYDVDYEQVTAGRYKRTLTMLGKNTEEGRAKFKEELEAIHERFKEQVLKFRPQLDIDKVATGEHWLALDALELGLIDEIETSEDYLSALEERTKNNMLLITFKKKPKDLRSRLRDLMSLKALSKMSSQDFIERRLQNDEPYGHIR